MKETAETMSVKKVKVLSTECSNKLRQSQIITRVSDVVRELIDNGIDANAKAIQVFLENYGVKRIEVRDSGCGISEDDLTNIFRGGYTSKLEDTSHLSCGDQYGFRGEALSSICSFSGVMVTTKLEQEAAGRKYVLDKKGAIISRHLVPAGTGTSIVVQELFKDFPVRQKYCTDDKNAKNELKLIEAYLKSVAIANYSVYMSLYHNSNMIWTKPAAKSTEHALATVFGIGISRLLTKAIVLEFGPSESQEDNTWKGTLELFVPKPPADMKSLGFTNNKMTMIFVNRRRVYITEFEQLLKRYAIASATCPTQAEQRKFPACVFLITIPPSEVDFNRETDKTKVFLNCKDRILSLLADMLKKCYDLDLNLEDSPDIDIQTAASASIEYQQGDEPMFIDAADESLEDTRVPVFEASISTPEKRRENITAFLNGMTSNSTVLNDSTANGVAVVEPDLSLYSKPLQATRPECDSFQRKIDDNLQIRLSNQVNLEVRESRFNDSGVGASSEGGSDIPRSPTIETPNEREISLSDGNVSLPCKAWAYESYRPFEKLSKSIDHVTQNENAVYRIPSSATSHEIEGEVPCNIVVHNLGFENLREQTILEPLTIEAPPRKRPKLFDSSRLIQAPKLDLSTHRARQVKLNDMSGWRSTLEKSDVCENSIPFKQNLFTQTKAPEESVFRNNATGQSSNVTDTVAVETCSPVVFKYRNAEGLLGISAEVDSDFFFKPNTPSFRKEPSGYDASVVHRLEGTNIFFVKIDGLLGMFHAERFLECFPFMKDPSHTSFTSSAYVLKLLIEFTKVWESMEREQAVSIFHVLSDLQELDDNDTGWAYPFPVT